MEHTIVLADVMEATWQQMDLLRDDVQRLAEHGPASVGDAALLHKIVEVTFQHLAIRELDREFRTWMENVEVADGD